MAAFKTYLFMLVGLLSAIYLNYPAPSNMSSKLTTWKTKSARTIVFNKTKVFYKDEPGIKMNAPILVCLHGFPTSSYDWLKIWPGLLQKFSRVIAPDFLGFGFSDKPTDHDYSIKGQADLVEYLLHYLRIKEVHLLAHDYGDTVAQELLARYEERVKDGTPKLTIKSVCFLNGGLFPDTNFPQPIQQILLLPYIGPILARLTNIYTFKRSFGSVFGVQTQPTDDEFNDFWNLIRKNDGNLVIPKLLQYIPERTAHKYRWTGVLQKTKVPVHVIYGPADPVNPPEFIDFYKEVVPGANVTVLRDHIGHYPQWEDSAECMAAYFNFLRTLPYSASFKVPHPPNVTTSTRITAEKTLPKMVLDKMKFEGENDEKAKSDDIHGPKDAEAMDKKTPQTEKIVGDVPPKEKPKVAVVGKRSQKTVASDKERTPINKDSKETEKNKVTGKQSQKVKHDVKIESERKERKKGLSAHQQVTKNKGKLDEAQKMQGNKEGKINLEPTGKGQTLNTKSQIPDVQEEKEIKASEKKSENHLTSDDKQMVRSNGGQDSEHGTAVKKEENESSKNDKEQDDLNMSESKSSSEKDSTTSDGN